MKKITKAGQIRRRLVTGFFCISLLLADFSSVSVAWAKEDVSSVSENTPADPSVPADADEEETEKPGGETPAPAESEEDGASGDETGDGETTPPAEGEEAEKPDGETSAPEENGDSAPSVSENDAPQEDISVSDNTLTVDASAVMAAEGDDIVSGTSRNINWRIDAAGKLTVEGSGDWEDLGTVEFYVRKTPWYDKREQIKTAEVKVTGMTNASGMFNECKNMTAVDVSSFDTSSVTDMSYMFSVCESLGSLDVSGFDTSSVTDMNYMFGNCCSLGSLDVSSFDTNSVVDMSYMFMGCSGLRSLDVSSFNTSEVRSMGFMFDGCEKLNSLDVSGFDTSSVTSMHAMFSMCESLSSLDVSKFNTSSVEEMSKMFWCCSGLSSLDVSGFDTSSVTSMNHMFRGCSGLSNLDVSGFDTSSVTDMGWMFSNCCSLNSIDLSKFDTSKVTDISSMFWCCESLGSLDVGGFDTSSVTDMSDMFSACESLSSLDVSSFDTSSVTSMSDMFSACKSLSSLDVSSLDTSSVTDMSHMFGFCENLGSLDVSKIDTSKVTTMDGMFYGCEKLSSLDVSGFDTSNVTNMENMFGSCSKLSSLDVSKFNTSSVKNMFAMFFKCESLRSLDLNGFDTSQVTVMSNMFKDCTALTTIYTPCNVKVDCALPAGTWYAAGGRTYTALPKNLPNSVFLKKGSKPEASSLEVSVRKTDYDCGETISPDDLTVAYYGTDGSVIKLKPAAAGVDGYTTNAAQIDMTTPGEKTLIVSYIPADGAELTKSITLTATYRMTEANITITLPGTGDFSYVYTGSPLTPEPVVQTALTGAAKRTLTKGTDYTVSYTNNVNASVFADGAAASADAPTVIVTGKGGYGGTLTKTFAIGKAAAPEKEYRSVMAAQCAQARENRKIDLTGCFKDCGAKTGYEITNVTDSDSIFSKTPVTADIKNGVLTYGTKATEEGKSAFLTIKVSFRNYQDASLTVVVCMVAKKAAVISGIEMQDSVYSGAPVSYGGTAVVKAEDGTDLTGKVSLVYHYSGTMADGKPYLAQGGASGNGKDQEGGNAAEAPVNAGSYRLTISVKDDDPDYVGSAEYPFTITKADAVVRAEDMVVLMQTGGGTVSVGQNGVGENSFGYETSGLLNGDKLTTAPSYTVTTDEEGKNAVSAIDISKAGEYYIQPSNADAGMNYNLTCRPGILMVSEERVAYTVTFDGMGHCEGFRKGGIKSGALLELTEEQRMPAAKEPGYVFAGWYKDKSFAKGKEWNFDTDTVQSDLTLYACWLTAAQDGSGLKLCVQELPDLVYTGSAQKPAVTVYDSDGETLLKAGKDYTVKYVNNTNAVAVGGDGKPAAAGGTASVVNPGKSNEEITDVIGRFRKDYPYVVITGKGNYTETICRNFLILPAQIAANGDGASAAGVTLKYTDQLVVNGKKDQSFFGSLKYKKAMKAGTDFTVSLSVESAQSAWMTGADGTKTPLPENWKKEGQLNGKKYVLPVLPKGYGGAFLLTVKGTGNYTGEIRRIVHASEKQNLMKNAAITLGRNQKTFAYTGEDVLLTPGYYDAATRKYHKVTAQGAVSDTAEANANDMFLVKAGKNGKAGGESLVWGRDYTIDYAGTNRAVGTATMTVTGMGDYVGTKSVTFKIIGEKFAANTIDVKAYDAGKPNDPQADAFRTAVPYTGKAVTQSQVYLSAKPVKAKGQTPAKPAKPLEYGTHYTISYKNNVKKGTASMTFTARPESGYSGSFKKTFKIGDVDITKEPVAFGAAPAADGENAGAGYSLTKQTDAKGNPFYQLNGTVYYSREGAKPSDHIVLTLTGEKGEKTVLKEGTDYTVSYANNTIRQADEAAKKKQPTMTVKGKGNYKGSEKVLFHISDVEMKGNPKLTVTAAAAAFNANQKKEDYPYKPRITVKDGKKALSAKDYKVDYYNNTQREVKEWLDALESLKEGGAQETDAAWEAVYAKRPYAELTALAGSGYGTDSGKIAVDLPIYRTKFAAGTLYILVDETGGQTTYDGTQQMPAVTVYRGDAKAVKKAKNDKVTDETALTKPTAQGGAYGLTKLKKKEGTAAGDYTVNYGANIAAGKNKGSVTVTGTELYGAGVTVKFTIKQKPVCMNPPANQ